MPPLRKRLTWPIRRLLDPRFSDISERIWSARQALTTEAENTRFVVTHEVKESVSDLVGGYAVSNVETFSLVGEELRRLEGRVEQLREQYHEHMKETRTLAAAAADQTADLRLAAYEEGTLASLDPRIAGIINFSNSDRSYASQAGLWFNPPVGLRHRQGGVEVANVNERIVEAPFAFRALAGLADDARVLDVGASESTIALSLASLGYAVTAVDPRPYPIPHPNLTSVAAAIAEWDPPQARFDAVLCVSTVEHIGLGYYGDPAADGRGDLEALAAIRRLIADDGRLILTVPYGTAGVDGFQRTYDAVGLAELLDGWDVRERRIVEETAPRTWTEVEETSGHAVAMIVAVPAA